MDLTGYYKNQATDSKVSSDRKLAEKKAELVKIFEKVKIDSSSGELQVAVLGCGDMRHVVGNKEIFEDTLGISCGVTTFDIDTDHLAGQPDVIKHDCTEPLPQGPFDITFAHVLLKFIPEKKQLNLILNSYNALSPGGLAIHVLDKDDFGPDKPTVLLNTLLKELQTRGIGFERIPLKYGIALVLIR